MSSYILSGCRGQLHNPIFVRNSYHLRLSTKSSLFTMPPKRKTTPTQQTFSDGESAHGSIQSSDAQICEQPVNRSKRPKISPKRQESPEIREDAEYEDDYSQKTPPNLDRTTAKASTKKLDAKGHSTKPAARTKTRATELKADVIRSRNEAEKKLEDAETQKEKLKTKIDLLSSKLARQSEKMQDLETSNRVASGLGRAYFQDDRTILDNMRTLFEMISMWASDWAHEKYLMLHMTEADTDATINMLQGCSEHLGYRMLQEDAARQFPFATAGCRIATEAFLSHAITANFILRPFNILLRRPSGNFVNMEDYAQIICNRMRSEFDYPL